MIREVDAVHIKKMHTKSGWEGGVGLIHPTTDSFSSSVPC